MYRLIIIFLSTGIIFISGCINKNNNVKTGQINSAKVSHTVKISSGINEFYFVGMSGKNPCIYKFTSKKRLPGIEEKNFSKFWSKPNEKVIKLSYSPDKKTLFLLTAEDFGRKAVLPFVNGIKVYCIIADSSKVKYVKQIGSGLQVFTMWGQDNTFRIILNSFDRNSTDYINQQTFIFNDTGKTVDFYSKKFNILNEGYPQIVEKFGLTTSPGSNYSIFAVDSTKTFIYLQNNSNGKVELITSTDQIINLADWSPDEKYLIFSTINPPQKSKTISKGISNNSKVFIYSIEENKIIDILEIGRINNFVVKGNLLIFDNGYRKNSFIEIINYKTLKPFYIIHIKGGCSLKSII
jgi:hypothetical protein